jgi:predicted LPLAT superfamily acyltransferase
MSRVAADLEAVVRAHPTQWFNFYRFWKDGSASEEAARSRPE